MKRPFYHTMLLFVLSAAAASWATTPAPMRDPTQPPAAYGKPVSAVRLGVDSVKPEQLVTINGVLYLVWNGRRYKTGDNIEGGRVERISESEVWLKTAGTVRKLPVFSGVEKRLPDSGASSSLSIRASTDRKNGSTK
jgi:hypothetical protein